MRISTSWHPSFLKTSIPASIFFRTPASMPSPKYSLGMPSRSPFTGFQVPPGNRGPAPSSKSSRAGRARRSLAELPRRLSHWSRRGQFGPARTQTRSVHTAKRGHSSPSSRGFHKTSPVAGWNHPYPSRETPPPVPPPPPPPNLRSLLQARDPARGDSSPAHTRNSHSNSPLRIRRSWFFPE